MGESNQPQLVGSLDFFRQQSMLDFWSVASQAEASALPKRRSAEAGVHNPPLEPFKRGCIYIYINRYTHVL